MTLYAANVLDVAKPIEKKGKKAAKPLPPVPEEEVVAEVSVKKELTEKQILAAEKRKRKREEAVLAKQAEEQAIKAKEEEIRAKEEEIVRKKEEAKEKRRIAREAKKAEVQEISPPPSSESSESVEEPKVKKPRKQRDEMEPPAWFQKYVQGVKSEEAKQSASRVPKKEVLQEAKQTAQQQWNDGLTRDRVQNEVDSHMSRMYGMIFSNRRFK